jgi:hypothetical protein
VTGGSLRSRVAALPPLPEHPLVSVVLAVRDEERHIAATLDAVRSQDWPREALEVIVADGASRDRTATLVAHVAARDPRVRLIANPERFVAQGLNRAIAAARGAVVVRVDGHCRVPPGYVRAAVGALRAGEAECAGGPVHTRATTALGRAIALAMSTRWGVGGASFRVARDRRQVEHLPFGAWRRETLAWLGGFDARFVRNQDDELSDRLRRAGGRILMLPEQAVDYWCRDSLAALGRQYHGYGFWKVRGIRLRGGWPSSPRHLVPAALLLGGAAGAVLGAVTGSAAVAALVPGLYASFLALASAHTWVTTGAREAALLPLVLPVLHGAYGAGFLHALAGHSALPPAEEAATAGAPESAGGREAA